MYVPEHFRTSTEDAQAFLASVRCGNLVSVDESTRRPMATFLPWVPVGDRLISHMGTVNPQSRHTGEALVVFMGDEAYISDEWMVDAAPTWDYETLHVYGRYRTHSDPQWIIDSWSGMLERFSHRTIDDYDPRWVEIQTRSVVGVEVIITDIEAKSKLSQNRTEPEIHSIIDHIRPSCPHLAARMAEVSVPHIVARDEKVRAIAHSHRFWLSGGVSPPNGGQ